MIQVHQYLARIREVGTEVSINVARSGIVQSALTVGVDADHKIEIEAELPETECADATTHYAPGASGAVSLGILAFKLSNPTAMAAVETPGYPIFTSALAGFGVENRPFSRGNDGELDWNSLVECLEWGTKLVCMTDPHNPSGAQLSPEHLVRLIELTSSYGAQLLIDRVFADFAEIPEAYLTIPVSGYLARSFSKSLGLGHRRFGWLTERGAANGALQALDVLIGQPLHLERMNHERSYASAISMEHGDSYRLLVRQNNEILRDAIASTNKIRLIRPESHLTFAAISLPAKQESSPFHELRDRYSVGVADGRWFGMPPETIRIGLGGPSTELSNALSRIVDYATE